MIQFDLFVTSFVDVLTRTGLLLVTVFLLALTRSGLRDTRPVYLWLLGGLAWLALYLGIEVGRILLIPDLGLSILLAGWIIFMLGVAQAILRARPVYTLPFIKARTYYWSIGVIITALGGIIFFDYRSPAGAGLLYAIGTLVLAATLIRPYMPDIRHMEQEVLNYLVMTILTALVLILGALAIVALLTRFEMDYHPTLVGAVIAFIMAALLAPLWLISHKIAQRLLPQVHFDPEIILREYSQAVSSILDPELLSTVAVGLISEKIEIQRGYLFLVEHEMEDTVPQYRLRGSKGMGTGLAGSRAACQRQPRRPVFPPGLPALAPDRPGLPAPLPGGARRRTRPGCNPWAWISTFPSTPKKIGWA